MMKKSILLFIILLSGIAFGQTKENKAIYCHFPAKPSVEINKIYENPDELAEFPEGLNAFRVKLMDAISSNFVKTGKADFNVETTISFIVEKDGSVSGKKFFRKLCEGYDEEAMKVIDMMTKWKPGLIKGVPVRTKMILPLRYKYK